MSWIYLFIAGIFEIVWAVALKYTDGFSNWFYSAVTIVNFQRFPTLDAKNLVNAPKMSAHHRGICHF